MLFSKDHILRHDYDTQFVRIVTCKFLLTLNNSYQSEDCKIGAFLNQ